MSNKLIDAQEHGFKALIGFVGAQSDALELLELAEEILD